MYTIRKKYIYIHIYTKKEYLLINDTNDTVHTQVDDFLNGYNFNSNVEPQRRRL